MFFLFLESLGTTELLVILVVALVLFGPRKLPELSRSLGRSLNEFKRAGDDFKRTWEREVAMENVEREAAIDRALVADPPAQVPAGENVAAEPYRPPAHDITEAALAPVQGGNIARGARFDPPAPADAALVPESEETAAAEQQPPPSRKTDWL